MSNLQELRSNFEKLKSIRLNIRKLFDSLETLKQKLKGIYLDYIEQNKKNDYTFGLDALHFQNTLIDLEYENMDKLYKLIDNKMYCEYYKLFKIICKYVEENTNEKKVIEICKSKIQFPIYKDLEQFKVYEFNLINEIHHNILQLFDEMLIIYKNKQNEIQNDQLKSIYGLNLDNYIFTISYKNETMFQNIKLFTRYLQSYHKYHTLYLSRLDIKLRLMWGQMNEDIKINSIQLNNSNESIIDSEPKLKRVPSISSKQQNEILNFIMKDNNNQDVKKEFESIMSNISDSNDEVSIDDIIDYDKQDTPKNEDNTSLFEGTTDVLKSKEYNHCHSDGVIHTDLNVIQEVDEETKVELVIEERNNNIEDKVDVKEEDKEADKGENKIHEEVIEENNNNSVLQQKKDDSNNEKQILHNSNNQRPSSIQPPSFASIVQRGGMVNALKKHYNR